MSNGCLISHLWYDVEKLTVPDSSNLNLRFSGAQEKVLSEKHQKKWVAFYFTKLQILHWKGFSKFIGEGWLLCAEVSSALSKLIFTHSVFCWSRSHEIVEK